MSVFTLKRKAFPSGLILIAAAFLPPLISAEPSNPNKTEWACNANLEGDWKCTREATAAVSDRVNKTLEDKPKKQTSTDSGNSYAQWDWVPKDQMKDASLCNKGCEGAYIEPTPNWQDAEKDPRNSEVNAEASALTAANQETRFNGSVIISQGYRRILANNVILDRNTQEMTVTGNVEIREPKLLIRAENAHINSGTSTGQFGNTQFLFHDQGIRGTAETLLRNKDNTTTIKNGTITQCTPDDETWLFEADNIQLDTETGIGTAKNAKLLVKGVPLVYLPYLTFPIDDRRTSGFLWPTFGSSDENGFNVSTPYYLNLAPNLDVTLAPQYISNRGTMFEAEVRQLGEYGAWTLSAAQLSDNLYSDNPSPNLSEKELNNLPTRENRWLGHIRQTGRFSGINTSIDYTRVSDDNYFEDLPNNSLEVKRTLHLKQLLALDYIAGSWRTEVLAEQRQTLDDDLNEQYKIMPRLSITRNNSGSSFEAQWLAQAEITDFQHDESIAKGGDFTTGQRAYVETGISYPMHWAAGFLIPTVKVRNLNYHLNDRQIGSDDTLTTTTPVATIDMGLIFERAAAAGGGEYTQTLEPRLYYFYSDYENQEQHPDFDSKELTLSYNQLFRDTRFSGHDRLDDANQMSFGVTSRLIENNSGREVITASIGQTFFFEDRRVTLEQNSTNTTQSKSFIATEIQYQPNNEVWFNNSLLWDSEREKLQEAGFGVHFQRQGNSLYNLSYKFRRDGDSNLITGVQHLEQVDASILLPINNHWSWYSRLQYDLTEKNSIDSLIGMQYEDCCWKVRLIYQESFDDEFISEPEGSLVVETGHAFIIEFQLKGLGGLGSKSIEILKESILGYEDLE